MKPQSLLLWHKPSNFLGMCDIRYNKGCDCPLIFVLDDEFPDVNPFCAYPLSFLHLYGWEILGEL